MYNRLKEIAETEEQKKIIEQFEETNPTEEQKEFFASLIIVGISIKASEIYIKKIIEYANEIKGAENEKNDK